MKTLSEAVRAEGYAFFTGPLDELRAAGWEPVQWDGTSRACLFELKRQQVGTRPVYRHAVYAPFDSWHWSLDAARVIADHRHDYSSHRKQAIERAALLAKWLRAVTS